jgi:hypothetical protein
MAISLTLAACSGKTDFSISKSFTANSAGTPATYSSIQPVNLPADAPEAWKHRSKVKSIELVGIDGTMTANLTGSATTGSGSIYLRPDGGTGSTDVLVGSWANEPIPLAAPHSIGVVLSPAAVTLIEDALGGSGLFAIVMSGATAAPVQFNADVILHLKLTYKVP